MNQRLQPQPIALSPKAANLPDRDRRNIRMMPKRFTLMNIAQMYLNRREGSGGDRISDRDAGMRVGSGIDQDAVMLSDRGMNRIDQSTLMIRLKGRNLHLKQRGFLL